MRLRFCWRRLAGGPNRDGKIGVLTVNSETEYIVSTEEIMSANIKEEARRLIENLPDDSTWEDLMYKSTSGKLSKQGWLTVRRAV
jgi:hypothetical protein